MCIGYYPDYGYISTKIHVKNLKKDSYYTKLGNLAGVSKKNLNWKGAAYKLITNSRSESLHYEAVEIA